MDPTVIGTKLASGLVGPLVKRLFVQEGAGAGLVDKPVRLSALVSFRGEKRTLGEKELRKLVRELVERAARETRGAPIDEGELAAVATALERTLHALGDLDLDDWRPYGWGTRRWPANCTGRRAATGRCGISAPTPRASPSVSSTAPACTSCTSSPSGPPLSPTPSSSRAGSWTG
ncbi:hypothetical protein ABIE67_005316 [Streptomyces sp. V4I8]